MLILGHAGITVGAALVGEAVLGHRNAPTSLSRPLEVIQDITVSLSQRIDLRVLFVASLLPDIIDKPLGLVLFAPAFGSGRLFAHTLWFPLALLAAGLMLRSFRGGQVLLVFAFGSGMHLLLDAMWLTPATLFWPLLGPFPQGNNPDQWLETIIRALLTNPGAYVPEIAGAILLLPLLTIVMGSKSLLRFLRTGSLIA
ncbi:MAG: metal-dependent hydrolase [Chloroflexota bacterium]